MTPLPSGAPTLMNDDPQASPDGERMGLWRSRLAALPLLDPNPQEAWDLIREAARFQDEDLRAYAQHHTWEALQQVQISLNLGPRTPRFTRAFWANPFADEVAARPHILDEAERWGAVRLWGTARVAAAALRQTPGFDIKNRAWFLWQVHRPRRDPSRAFFSKISSGNVNPPKDKARVMVNGGPIAPSQLEEVGAPNSGEACRGVWWFLKHKSANAPLSDLIKRFRRAFPHHPAVSVPRETGVLWLSPWDTQWFDDQAQWAPHWVPTDTPSFRVHSI